MQSIYSNQEETPRQGLQHLYLPKLLPLGQDSLRPQRHRQILFSQTNLLECQAPLQDLA